MSLRYLSVCSGIEAATVAWEPLGWTPFGFAEIEAFPCAVLAHHYGSNYAEAEFPKNGVPNFGNMESFRTWPDAAIDVLVGGTPCQSFSVAGLRKGLADPRGNLCLTYLAIADRYKPAWIVWENVPGVLSSNEGRDFGAFLGGLGQLGYGFAYRVLDAQYVRVDGFGRAVPQRRRRVFVVGHLGDWRRAAAVLFERESLQGHSAPRREAGKRVAPTISARPTGGGGLGTDFDYDGGLISLDIVPAMTTRTGTGTGTGRDGMDDFVIAHPLRDQSNSAHDDSKETYIAHALRADGFDASEDGTGRGTPIIPCWSVTQDSCPVAMEECSSSLKIGTGLDMGQPPCIAFSAKDHGGDALSDCSPTLRAGGFTESHANAGVMPAVAFQPRFARNDRGAPDVVAAPLTAEAGRTGKGDSAQCVATNWAVRRLTPLECERLQAFPDGYTVVPCRGKPASDGPRYKALGNSMAVNVMRWLGHRIELMRGLP